MRRVRSQVGLPIVVADVSIHKSRGPKLKSRSVGAARASKSLFLGRQAAARGGRL